MPESKNSLISEAAKFANVAPERVSLIRSPYRVCPLGAHVDHQNGRVLGMALDQSIRLAFSPTDDGKVRLKTRDFDQGVEFDLDSAAEVRSGWGAYAAGALLALRDAGHSVRKGIAGVLSGSLPIGGLSSSAAVTTAYLLALESANDLQIDAWENIRLEQRVENGYIGLNNGILDQSVIILSKQERLLSLDCATEKWRLIPGPSNADFGIAVVFSGVASALKSTGYNQRVDECAAAAEELLLLGGLTVPEKPRLRDAPPGLFEAYERGLSPVSAKRARHFFTENDRVERGERAWAEGDLALFGQLINESGQSSVENYECGCPELITLYEVLRDTEGVLGARFSGGGFRGSCVALYRPGAEEGIRRAVAERYPAAYPELAKRYSVHFCHSADGATSL